MKMAASCNSRSRINEFFHKGAIVIGDIWQAFRYGKSQWRDAVRSCQIHNAIGTISLLPNKNSGQGAVPYIVPILQGNDF